MKRSQAFLLLAFSSILVQSAQKQCFSGFYDLWGGEYGSTEFTSMDATDEKVLACGYSQSNYDGFVTFDKNIVSGRPLIGVFNQFLDVQWMKQYHQPENGSVLKELQSQGVNSCRFSASQKYVVAQLYFSAYSHFTILILGVSDGALLRSLNLADTSRSILRNIPWTSFAHMPFTDSNLVLSLARRSDYQSFMLSLLDAQLEYPKAAGVPFIDQSILLQTRIPEDELFPKAAQAIDGDIYVAGGIGKAGFMANVKFGGGIGWQRRVEASNVRAHLYPVQELVAQRDPEKPYLTHIFMCSVLIDELNQFYNSFQYLIENKEQG